MDVQKMSSVIVYQFLLDWYKTCLNTPWTSKRCPQSDRLLVPIWLTQNLFEHHMDVQKMSSKRSSTSSNLTNTTPAWTPRDVQMMSSKWSSTCSYLTSTKPVWTPQGRPNDVLKVIAYQFLFKWPSTIWTPHGRAKDVLKVIVYQFPFDCDNTCLKTPWTSKRCPQIGRLPVPIWLAQNQFEHHRDVQKMSSKWSSTSSYLTDTTPSWTPRWASKRCPQSDRLRVPICLSKNLFEHPMDAQKMSSMWSSTSSYLSDTTPAWTPHEHPKDVLKVIVYQFLFDWHNICLNTPWTSKWCPQRDPLQVPIWVSQPYLNTPWTCKRCPQSDRLPVPIWLTQHLLQHSVDVQMMSSKWSSTSSYLCVTKPIWTPHGRPKDVINVIVYQFLFEWHKTCLNTPWTSKRCPQWSSTSSYLAEPTLFEHPKDVRKMSSKWSSTSSYLIDTTPAWKSHGRPKDVLKMVVYLFLFD